MRPLALRMLCPLPLALAVGCPTSPQDRPPVPVVAPAHPAAEAPALVVYVVVDQLGEEQLDRMIDRFKGGLARLTSDTAYRAVARYHHSSTETCPGHATLATGGSPAVHGIVGNSFVLKGKEAYCLDALPLPVDTVGDAARAAGGEVVSLSLKDRGSVLLSGRAPTLAMWMDRRKGAQVSLPLDFPKAVTPPLVARDAWVAWMDPPWTLSDPSLEGLFGIQDQQAHERDVGTGLTFPHPGPAGALPAPALPSALMNTPAGGDFLTAAALEAVDRFALGQNGPPDLLTVSYSHFDGIGHSYTPASLESLDALLRLDGQLQELMDGLDAKVGPGRWSLVLSADHGAPMIPPTYVDLDDLPAAIDAALKAEGLPAAALFFGTTVVLDPALDADGRARSAAVVRRLVLAVPGVEDLVDLANPEGPFAAAFAQSRYQDRAGDLTLVLAENAVPLYKKDPTGTTHGSPRPYDQQVPFLAFGAGVKAGKGPEVDARQIAPTVVRLLHAPPLSGAELPAVAAALR